MNLLYFVLLLLGAVCFAAAALSFTMQRINLVALGLLFWVLVPLIQTAQHL